MSKLTLLKLIDEAIAADEIMEFQSKDEALSYFNIYDYQNFKTVEEMIEYQGEYGFGLNEKWYHINYDDTLNKLKDNGYLEWKEKGE